MGYPARSVFKLQEIHEKYKLFRPGSKVLDLGCCPGSWTLYAAKQVGEKGLVLGLDISPKPETLFPPNVKIMQQDVLQWDFRQPFLRNLFDCVLSDMAPDTTGQESLDIGRSVDLCNMVLDIALDGQALKQEGSLVMKILQGKQFDSVRERTNEAFRTTKVIIPAATRKSSREVFIYAKGVKSKRNE